MPVSRWPWRMESGRSSPKRCGELRLVVEQIHLRRRAGLEQVDHALGFGREIGEAGQPLGGVRARRKQSTQCGGADAGGGAAEQLPAREHQLVFAERIHWRVITSSRFRMTLAAVVYAASSAVLDRSIARRFARRQQLFRRCGVGAILREAPAEALFQHAHLCVRGRP